MILVMIRNFLLSWQYYDIHNDHRHAIDHLQRASYTGQNYDTLTYHNYTTEYP